MSGDTVLIAATRDDAHALVVMERLRRLDPAARPVLLDTVTFPISTRLDWSMTTSEEHAHLSIGRAMPLGIALRAGDQLAQLPVGDAASLDAQSVRAVWLRRPRAVSVSGRITEPELRRYAHLTNREVLEGFLSMLHVHNDPASERRASLRTVQLSTARRIGLRIPETLITSSADRARAFVDRLASAGNDVIYKQVAEATASGPPTRLVREEDLARLADVELCPAMFQARATGGSDLRVAVVGRSVFAAEWRTEHGPSDGVDVRLEPGVRMWPTKLDARLEAQLVRLHGELGLTFGVYDLKEDERGAVFLEVNPVGQWLDLEIEAGHAVSHALAHLLWTGASPTAHEAPLGEDDVRTLVMEAEQDITASA